MNAEFKISLEPVSNENAQGLVKDILDGTQAKMGFVPNMYRTMGNSAGYLDTYAHGYKAFRQSSGFTPQEQEVVFLVISGANGCDYCTAAHSMIADKVAKFDAQLLAAIRNGDDIADEKLQALAHFTAQMFESRGLISNEDADAFFAVGFSEQHILDIILAISVKTLSNYSNHVFHTDLDREFAAYKIS
ncbi:MAG: alkylhydroperoxidase [Hyphomicrobiales bacterium]|nr:carboxymuconolactone decarboxylase family protein [Hyphomicrobiales bacterium]PCJ87892.1 MAG: alkylhydroperoxidase [Hyphomicrobiales bacterium]